MERDKRGASMPSPVAFSLVFQSDDRNTIATLHEEDGTTHTHEVQSAYLHCHETLFGVDPQNPALFEALLANKENVTGWSHRGCCSACLFSTPITSFMGVDGVQQVIFLWSPVVLPKAG